MAKEALQRSEESAELLAEKAMVTHQEAMLLQVRVGNKRVGCLLRFILFITYYL